MGIATLVCPESSDLSQIKAAAGARGVMAPMASFFFRCPNTGLNVQGWVADDPSSVADQSYVPVTCSACTRVHLVNPKTGRVLAADRE